MKKLIPIDFQAIAKESGLRRGKICRSTWFGWCVQNVHGDDGPSMVSITPPKFAVAIRGRNWVLEKPPEEFPSCAKGEGK